MSKELDIRKNGPTKVDTIRFAEGTMMVSGCNVSVAGTLTQDPGNGFVRVVDGQNDYVLLNSKQHAKDLIQAIEAAMTLGWFPA